MGEGTVVRVSVELAVIFLTIDVYDKLNDLEIDDDWLEDDGDAFKVDEAKVDGDGDGSGSSAC